MKSAALFLPPALLMLYLLAWPVDIAPVAWTPGIAPSLEQGTFARNDRLRAVQRIADGAVAGPEAIAFDSAGRLYTGVEDGSILRIDPRDGRCAVVGNTQGRPLGLVAGADGYLHIADARKGLLGMSADGQVDVLAEDADGIALGFADDLAADPGGYVYFSDASWKFGYGEHLRDVLEHGGRGRLLRYDPELGEAVTLLAGLQFANGVALGPDAQYVLVAESGAYRVTRYWLKGEQAGTSEVFIDNLPGLPDNLTFNGRDRFWVALYAPRNALLDTLAPHPFWRTVVARLPAFLMPAPDHHAMLLGVDLQGEVAEQYQFADGDAYAPITSVREHGDHLYLGSLDQTAIGRVSLSTLRGGSTLAEPPAPLPSDCEG